MNGRNLFEARAPHPDEPVVLIYPRVRKHWAFHAWAAVLAVVVAFVIPALLMRDGVLRQLGFGVYQLIHHDHGRLFADVLVFLAITAGSVAVHEGTHLFAATVIGKATGRFSVFRLNPAMFWYGSISRNHAILTLLLPCVLWGILPLLMLAHLSTLATLIIYVPISQNLVGSRTDIAQAFYLVRFLPPSARIYCHPEGLAFAHTRVRNTR